MLPAVRPALLISCEHGGNRVPPRYRSLLRGAERALASHRGWDAGALDLAQALSARFDAPLFACTTTRLLVDPNRSLGHRALFSEWTRGLDAAERDLLIERCWRPHRVAVETAVRARAARRRPLLHVSAHSFTSRLAGVVRRADVGFLYDPKRPLERALVRAGIDALARRRPELVLRRNYPYRGTSDGLTTHLRTLFDAQSYAGIEVEVSQRLPAGAPRVWRALVRDLAESLARALERASPTV